MNSYKGIRGYRGDVGSIEGEKKMASKPGLEQEDQGKGQDGNGGGAQDKGDREEEHEASEAILSLIICNLKILFCREANLGLITFERLF